ncbi:MAG: hypothetical protein E7526_02885 [Ruminococcaceae bacterium]|nr:hypothetical protein [Oscillospiraceae bacterium]
MNKSRFTWMVSIAGLIFITVLTLFCLLQKGIIRLDFSNSQTQIHSSIETTEPTQEYFCSLTLTKGASGSVKWVTPETYYLEDGFDCVVQLNDITVTKECKDINLTYTSDEITDGEGRIINDYSYVIADITFCNKATQPFNTCVGSAWLVYGELGTSNVQLSEIRGYDVPIGASLKSYYMVTLEPNKEYTYKIAYVLKDSEIEKNKDNLAVNFTTTYGGDGAGTIIKAPVLYKQEESN